uniref:NADH dehydrogenase subunit 6 n=1 Tax=Perna perna TaxID=94826 RepID=A0A0B4U2F1_PERPR|nr:NADH dehydrogenase subunit 6 [Perna perna]AJC00156.1 NADH dehydrogenase subunit 6 [Perna perna]
MCCSLCLLISFLVFVSEPYPLGSGLILTCFGLCYGLAYYVSSLLGFLVFVGYVGGVMVLFLYVVSIHPNQKFTLKSKRISLLIFLVLVLFTVPVWYLSNRVEGSSLSNLHFINGVNFMELFVFMGLILLVNLCIVCCLCMKKSLPLRTIPKSKGDKFKFKKFNIKGYKPMKFKRKKFK